MKRAVIIALGIVLALCLALFYFVANAKQRLEEAKKTIPDMSFQDMLCYTLKDNEDGVITVGIIKQGKSEKHAYGTDGVEIADTSKLYEIGSISKTVTAAMVYDAVKNNIIEINKSIDNYIPLKKDRYYPTVAELISHTSGYKPYYFEWSMLGTKLSNKNDFLGINSEKLINRLNSINLKKESHGFRYSNFGYAVLGEILKNINGKPYYMQLKDKLSELNMQNSFLISDQKGIENRWEFKPDDVYLSAGGIVSNIEDMLNYAEFQLLDSSCSLHAQLAKTPEANEEKNAWMGMRFDAVAYGWMMDMENNFYWHNGATGHYNSYMAFSPERDTAVIILSNLKNNYRIPATIMGPKLMKEVLSSITTEDSII
ncbi:MAG: serine hydrolase domain-containing protein [Eubacteriales bacterium]|nr:serine hydrolase domain-containing protein [Eubacteriales bacterium]